MGINLTKSEVKAIVEDEELMDEIVAAALDNPSFLDDLAKEVASELLDEFENDLEFRKRLTEVVKAPLSLLKNNLRKKFGEVDVKRRVKSGYSR